MAAEGYARVTGTVGVLNVTSGPGGINALNGVFGAWTDSIPMLVISGQVKRETCMAHYGLRELRQLGDQEADIIRTVRHMTKYAVLVTDPKTIRYHLERAFYLAGHGRPGPCWIDIPLDVQSSQIDADSLRGYDPAEDSIAWDRTRIADQCRQIAQRLRVAERPVVLVGTGIRLAGAIETFHRVVERLGIPVTTAFAAHDLMASDDPHCCGRPGSLGDRPGNFAVQNADLLLVVGSRLNVRQVSYNWKTFARHAYKVQVDIDAAELDKPTAKIDLPIHCDAKLFLEELERQLDVGGYQKAQHAGWLRWCRQRVARYPAVTACQRHSDHINPYHFLDVLYRRLAADDVMVCGDGSACVITFHVAHVKNGQRLFCNSGCAVDGLRPAGGSRRRCGPRRQARYLPGGRRKHPNEHPGVADRRAPRPADQDLRPQQRRLPVDPPVAMELFQQLVGEGPRSGVSFPDMVKVATAYGIPALRLDRPDFHDGLDRVLAATGPFLTEVVLDPEQPFEPKLAAKPLGNGTIVSPPLEDMAPFLDKDELRSNLLVPEITY